MDKIDSKLLATVADLYDIPEGAYNIRKNGQGFGRHSTENIIITTKEDKPGIDILVKPNTKAESLHIPVIVSEPGLNDLVYNDFEIGENADVVIVAGCGIHNSSCTDSSHDGIHRFHLQKGAKLRYVEKHYGEGDGTGKRILNPVTIVEMEEDSYCEMETVQIKGVDSTVRTTNAILKKGAKIVVSEKLMTHGDQVAKSDMEVKMNGENSAAQIISRTVGKDNSVQTFNPRVIGNANCSAHVQCDSIIMGNSKISAIPEIAATHPDATLIHEAAIGKIAGDQILKLMTLGLTPEQAEEEILKCFLK